MSDAYRIDAKKTKKKISLKKKTSSRKLKATPEAKNEPEVEPVAEDEPPKDEENRENIDDMGQSGTGAKAGTPPGAEGGEDAPEIMATEVLMGGEGKQSQEPESVHVKSSTSTSTPVKPSYQFEERNFDNLEPRDYGIEFSDEEFNYVPPERDDTLPDLYRLMDTLEGGDSDLESSVQPPNLFTRPEHVPNYKKISELKLQLEEENIEEYVQEFDETVEDDMLMIGSISLEEVQEEEKRLRDEHIAYQEQEAFLARQRQEQILMREEDAKKRMAKTLKEKRKELARKEEIGQQKERLLMDRMHKAFRHCENQLTSTLERRKGEVKTMFGDLTMADGQFGGSKGRRWKVDWNKTPQPIQVKIKCLRGVKDKLPSGRYILMVSLYNRLGGNVMRWSKLKGQQWGGATLPTMHDGHFYNAEMKFDQSVFTVVPAKPDVRPGMILTFELFLLRGGVVPTDRVVGWGAFPISDSEFDIIEGKFKAPMLRGEMDFMIDKHEKIERLMASDLDHWLCNLYFEVIRLPRYMAGQKEFEVELQFSSGLLSHPDRVNTGGELNKDGENPIAGSAETLGGTPAQSRSASQLDMKKMFGSQPDGKNGLGVNMQEPDNPPVRPMTTIGSRHINKDRRVQIELEDSSDDEYDEDDDDLKKKEQEFMPVKGEPGLFYKKYTHNPVDEYAKKMFTMLPRTPLLNKPRKKRKLTHIEDLEQHAFSVRPPFSQKGHMKRASYEKMNYVGRMFFSELGLSQWRSREFWGMLTMFILIFFARIYLHYLGQWIFLNAIQIPINKFDFLPYTVSLNYQSTLLHTREEIAMVALGPLLIIIIFTFLVIMSWLMQLIFGHFPDFMSKFVVVFGLQAVLDPILIMIIDAATLRFRNLGGDNPIADFTKLYWHFFRAEGSGVAGIFITVFLYLCIMFTAGSILYMYFLRLHNNGRMLDIYWRLHGDEEMFFVPYDLEISNYELSYICKKAEQWRGEEGERRKVAVYDYVWEEEDAEETLWDELKEKSESTKKELTTHVAIHTLHLDGLRELYRHFLRLPDGSVVEVFGDMSVTGMDKDMKSALEEGTKNVENLMGSQTSLNKVRGRQTAMTMSGLKPDDGSQFLRGSPLHSMVKLPNGTDSETESVGQANKLKVA